MDQNMHNIICTHCLQQLLNHGLNWNKTDFQVSWNITNQIHWILRPKLLYFVNKKHKVFKNKVKGWSTSKKTGKQSDKPLESIAEFKNLDNL